MNHCSTVEERIQMMFHRTVRLPYPIWVRVALPDGEEQMVIESHAEYRSRILGFLKLAMQAIG